MGWLMPALKIGAIAGKTAGKILDKGDSSVGVRPTAVQSTVNAPQVAPGPPMSASSLSEARTQDKSRMKRQYGL
jgi:hypothetical protein